MRAEIQEKFAKINHKKRPKNSVFLYLYERFLNAISIALTQNIEAMISRHPFMVTIPMRKSIKDFPIMPFEVKTSPFPNISQVNKRKKMVLVNEPTAPVTAYVISPRLLFVRINTKSANTKSARWNAIIYDVPLK